MRNFFIQSNRNMTTTLDIQAMMGLVKMLSDNLEAQDSAGAQIKELQARTIRLEAQFKEGLERLKEMCMRILCITTYPPDLVTASPREQLDFLTRAAESVTSYETLARMVH